jgi:RND family efflux transporter MFP subunit
MPRSRRASLVAVAALPVLSLSACKPHPDADPRIADRLVQVAEIQPAGDLERTYTGVVAARVQSDLGFRVQGKVVERLVDTGQVVTLGQPLMRIDPTDYTHAVTVQTGDVAAARARWVQAAADEKRYRGLVASGAVSQTVYDQAKAAADSTRALLSAAEAQEKVARNQGDYSVLLADADGTVVETLAEPGQVVAPGQTVIRLAHAGPREASVNLPETERPDLGAPARANLYGDMVHVSAHLRQLSDAADPRTRTFEARYVLDGDGAKAPLGATVTLSLASARPAATMQVPLGAIDDEGQGPGIWVVNPKTFQVNYRPVKVQQFGGETALLSGGAQPGEQVVAAGGHFLHENEHVRPIGEKAAMR